MTAFTGALGWAMPCDPSDSPAMAERARIADALDRLAKDPALAQAAFGMGQNDIPDALVLRAASRFVRGGAVVPGGQTGSRP